LYHRWTEDEVCYVVSNIRTKTYREIASDLTIITGEPFTWLQVFVRAKRLGYLRKDRVITEDEVLHMRNLYKDGVHTIKRLANKFNIDKTYASRILQGKRMNAFGDYRSPKPPEPRYFIVAYGEKKSVSAWERDPRCRACKHTLAKRVRAIARVSPSGGLRPPSPSATPKGEEHVYVAEGEHLLRGIGKKRGAKPLIEAFGEVKSLEAWIADPRCELPRRDVERRLRRGFKGEDVLRIS
jgi:hypothetical protein